MNKIESMTSEQEASMAAYVQECLRIGRSTEPADRPRAEAAITRMYERLRKPAPQFYWFDGPATGSMARALLTGTSVAGANLGANLGDNLWANLWANLRGNLRNNLWANLGANLGDNLGDNLWANLWANLRGNLGDNLGDNLGGSLGANLWANLRGNLGDNLGDNLRGSLGDSLGDSTSWIFWGAWDLPWIAFYKFAHDQLREMHSEDDYSLLCDWWGIACSAGFWEPCENVVIICERPQSIKLNNEGFLHCEDGPAMLCRDGFPVHAFNGVRVPDKWVTEKMPTPTELLAHPDVEQRAAGMQVIGMDKMLDEIPHAVIDSDEDPQHGDLLELTLDGLPETEYYLRFYCPRNGLMVEGVNKRELEEPTVFAAQAWKAGISTSLFEYPTQRS